jgi:hypothetical protein
VAMETEVSSFGIGGNIKYCKIIVPITMDQPLVAFGTDSKHQPCFHVVGMGSSKCGNISNATVFVNAIIPI